MATVETIIHEAELHEPFEGDLEQEEESSEVADALPPIMRHFAGKLSNLAPELISVFARTYPNRHWTELGLDIELACSPYTDAGKQAMRQRLSAYLDMVYPNGERQSSRRFSN